MPSRLKGIETQSPLELTVYSTSSLYMPSRLKGIETQSNQQVSGIPFVALYMPSRLKGIETLFISFTLPIFWMIFVYAFPFEGN